MTDFDPVLELVRLEESEEGTFGMLRLNKRCLCLTLEPQDRENERDRSCVPAQQYRCRRVVSPRFGETFALGDVPGRDAVLLHPGNTAADTRGCILLGERLASPDGPRGLRDSRRAHETLMRLLAGRETFHLTIGEHY